MKLFLLLFSFFFVGMGTLMASASVQDIAVECVCESDKLDAEEKSKDLKLDLYASQSFRNLQLTSLKHMRFRHRHIGERYFAAPFKPPRS